MPKGLLVAIILGLSLFIGAVSVRAQDTTVKSVIVEAVVTGTGNGIAAVRLIGGKLDGRKMTVKDYSAQTQNKLTYRNGDRVIVTLTDTGKGNLEGFVSDVDRRPALSILFLIFLALTVVVARWQGITSFLAMLFSFYIISFMVIPNILEGTDPMVAVLIASLFILPVTYFLSHGFGRKTVVALASTFLTFIIAGAMTAFFVRYARLSGYASEEAAFLSTITGTSHINILNLLQAGIVIGFLAILDDITISQSSIVETLRKSDPKLGTAKLYSRAMKVGRDHVASLVNTLVLVYVGASFPLVLLFYNNPVPIGLILNQEIIATEIVRTLIGSIAIIAAVPVSTYLACLYVKTD